MGAALGRQGLRTNFQAYLFWGEGELKHQLLQLWGLTLKLDPLDVLFPTQSSTKMNKSIFLKVWKDVQGRFPHLQ